MKWRHEAIVAAESMRFYERRRYTMYQVDDRHFHALNPDGHILGLNGYCLDAIEEIPAGGMSSCARMPTIQTVVRGTDWSYALQREREDFANRLIDEILAEAKVASTKPAVG